MKSETRRPGKQESIDKRFALVDTTGELRYPYKKTQRGTGKRGFVVGEDRHGSGRYLDHLEDVIRSVVFEGRRLRVTVDPPTEGKGSNGLSLHAGREVVGYVIAEELENLVIGAPIAPIGSPASYPRPASQLDSSLLAVCGVLTAKDLARLASADEDAMYLMRAANWSAVASELRRRPEGSGRLPFLFTTEDTVDYAVWIADVESVRCDPGPRAIVILRNFGVLPKPIAVKLLSSMHTGQSLKASSEKADIPCVLPADVAGLLSERLPSRAVVGETLCPVAIQAVKEVAEDPQCVDLPETVRVALANARVGQGGYRSRMLALWGGQCAVTDCSIESVLVASHAKPWAASSNAQRLDEYNGLLLAASIDKLFDAGLIGFDDTGSLLASSSLSESDLASVGLSRASHLRRILPRHLPYVKAHRDKHSLRAIDAYPIASKDRLEFGSDDASKNA